MTIQLTETRQCPGCGDENKRRLLYRLDRTNVYRCKCGLEFISPSLDPVSMTEIYRSSETLKEMNGALQNYYEYDVLNPSSLTYRDYSQALEKLSNRTAGRRLLEVGCGTGSFLMFARTKGWQVTGLDSSPENIAALKKKGIDGYCSDYLAAVLPEKFDVIVLWDLIEHPQLPVRFVEKSRTLLKPGGFLLLATPLYPNLLSLMAGVIYRLSGGALQLPVSKLYFLEHTSYFNLGTLSHLIGREGFRTVCSWKTETDLKRYSFSLATRTALRAAFLAARCLDLQNRLIVIARFEAS